MRQVYCHLFNTSNLHMMPVTSVINPLYVFIGKYIIDNVMYNFFSPYRRSTGSKINELLSISGGIDYTIE